MPYWCQQVHTNNPQVVIAIEEPWTPRLTARTLLYQTGFLLSAMNTQYKEVGLEGETLCASFLLSTLNTHKNNPKVAVEGTGGRGIQVDFKSGECQQQTPEIGRAHV